MWNFKIILAVCKKQIIYMPYDPWMLWLYFLHSCLLGYKLTMDGITVRDTFFSNIYNKWNDSPIAK